MIKEGRGGVREAVDIPPARVGSIEVRPVRSIRETVAAARATQPPANADER